MGTVRWGGKADVWSWPLTKIRVLMYFLVLNSIFGSKYPIFVEPITIKFQKTFFQAVSTKNLCLLELAWGPPDFLGVSVKQTILCLFTCVCELLEACQRISDARLQNKQQKNIDLPPQVELFLIGWAEISTPWRCPKIWTKKVRKFFWNS